MIDSDLPDENDVHEERNWDAHPVRDENDEEENEQIDDEYSHDALLEQQELEDFEGIDQFGDSDVGNEW